MHRMAKARLYSRREELATPSLIAPEVSSAAGARAGVPRLASPAAARKPRRFSSRLMMEPFYIAAAMGSGSGAPAQAGTQAGGLPHNYSPTTLSADRSES